MIFQFTLFLACSHFSGADVLEVEPVCCIEANSLVRRVWSTHCAFVAKNNSFTGSSENWTK